MSKMSVITVLGLLAAVMFITAGCEVGSATERIIVSPSSVSVTKGQSVQFTASGGYDYTWTLESATVYGSLSSRTGNTVVYTSIYDSSSSNTVSETLKVVSTIPGDASPTNTSTSAESSAEATITHI